MKITCLMENTTEDNTYLAEHGFSVLIETEENTILVDTGASDAFLKNAQKLGIDLHKVEAVFLSHGHYDHGGGILPFRKENPKTPVLMQKKALGDYWHISDQVEKYIGLDQRIEKLESLVLLEGDFQYNENIMVFTGNFNREPECWPKGNLVLKEKREGDYIQDSFAHEQYIVIREQDTEVLISGCAHNGILNILEEYKEKFGSSPDVVISGFHMKKKTEYTSQDYEIMTTTAYRLKETNSCYYTGHCTGEEPFRIMKGILGEQLKYIHCGDVFCVAHKQAE